MNEKEYIEAILNFRKQKDEFFKHHPNSPIPSEERATFKGLKYFDPDIKYRFSVKINEYDKKEKIYMLTSTGDTQLHNVFGYVEFEINGKKQRLQVYTSDRNPDYYFVPFMDLTSGKETYGAGRYLELEHDKGNPERFILDFNLAYNPYCAYNDAYSCPIPPKENRLQVRIEAGEKNYREY